MLTEHYKQRLLAKPDQGKVFEVTSLDGVRKHFLRDGNFTRIAEWRFVHRARLGVVPLNAMKRWMGPDANKSCRKCEELKTPPHVLQHCGVHCGARIKLHDSILDRLAKATHLPGETRVNRAVGGFSEGFAGLRPDLVVRDEESHQITIIDVAVPFDNRRGGTRGCKSRQGR